MISHAFDSFMLKYEVAFLFISFLLSSSLCVFACVCLWQEQGGEMPPSELNSRCRSHFLVGIFVASAVDYSRMARAF